MPRIAGVGSSDAAIANNVEVNSSTESTTNATNSGGGGGGGGGSVPFHKPGTRSARGAAGGRGGRGGGGRGGKRQDPLKGGFKFGTGKK